MRQRPPVKTGRYLCPLGKRGRHEHNRQARRQAPGAGMSGPLASWLLAHLPAEATRTDRLVGTILALDANHDGSGADETREQMAELAGASPSAVSRSLRRLMAWRFVAAGPEQPGRRRPRMRMVLVRWCAPEVGCQPCAQLAPWHRKVATSDNSSPGKVVTGAPKGGHQWQPLRNGSRPSDQQRLARLTAEANLRTSERPPDTDHRWAGGRSAPPGTPLGSEADASECASKPSNQAREATAGAVVPFPARSSDAGAHGGAARTGSRPPPGAATGGPVLHPDGRLFEPEPAPIREHWR
jgi:hypothetical protein